MGILTKLEKFNNRINLRAELNEIQLNQVTGIKSNNIKAMIGIYTNRLLYGLTMFKNY